MNGQRVKLPNGIVADWEDRGNRLAVYGPMKSGYRMLLMYATLSPSGVWAAFRERGALGVLLPAETVTGPFASPGDVVEWLAGGLLQDADQLASV